MEQDDGLQVYLDRARRYGLLTREEEQDLSLKVKLGERAEKKLSCPDVPAEERKALLQVVAEGKGARERFLNANLRLVVSLAVRFRWTGLSLQDLVQEGNIGLMHALEKFDPERGFKFSTYASWWIRQAMMRASQQSDMIRLPVYKVEMRNRVRRAEGVFRSDHGPTIEEVAHEAGVSVQEVHKMRNLAHVSNSLDEPVGDEDTLLVELMSDAFADDPERKVIATEVGQHIGTLFEDLSARDRLIFDMRYGEEAASLEEIGQAVGLTRERVRQILMMHHKAFKVRAIKLGVR